MRWVAEYRRRFHFIHSLASAPVRTAPRFLRVPISMSLGDVRVPPTPLATLRRSLDAPRPLPHPRKDPRADSVLVGARSILRGGGRRRPRRARGGRLRGGRRVARSRVRLSQTHPAEPRARARGWRRRYLRRLRFRQRAQRAKQRRRLVLHPNEPRHRAAETGSVRDAARGRRPGRRQPRRRRPRRRRRQPRRRPPRSRRPRREQGRGGGRREPRPSPRPRASETDDTIRARIRLRRRTR